MPGISLSFRCEKMNKEDNATDKINNGIFANSNENLNAS